MNIASSIQGIIEIQRVSHRCIYQCRLGRRDSVAKQQQTTLSTPSPMPYQADEGVDARSNTAAKSRTESV